MGRIKTTLIKRTVEELMASHNIYVTLEDEIVTALDIMYTSDLMDIPVVNGQGKILGDITLSEILLNLL